ncbi:hypothetical protein [Methylobacterium sp. sgz302541]|uniref:hypothetical protein n=1 Tax=unclassified Methylobacterium TaxID=2615210 RepID=UPI003D325E8D
MAAPSLEDTTSNRDRDPVSILRARALADARQLRLLACVALRDGAPRADLRAANARAAARSVLAHARRLSRLTVLEHTPG